MPALKVKSPAAELAASLRTMRKGDFLAVFGGSHKVNIEWAAKYGLPWRDGPTVDVVEIFDWYREQFKGGATGDLNAQKLQAEIEKLKLQSARLEREEMEARGELMNRQDVTRSVCAMLAILSESMMTLPDKLAPRLPDNIAVECVEVMRGDIERFLKRLGEAGEDLIGKETAIIDQIRAAETCPNCQTKKECPTCTG